MNKVQLVFLGSGDAFGSGSRLQSCILIKANQNMILLECGASSMIALRKYQVDYDNIRLVLVSNLHGDHFGGIPYFIWDAQLNRKRNNPLVIAGPRGIKEKYPQLMESTFPGSEGMKTRFPLEIVELEANIQWIYEGITVIPFPVVHADNDPHLAFRISMGEKDLAYSGDTGWTESLVSAASGADLFIAESYFYATKLKYHLDYQTLIANQNRLNAKSLVITHMSEDMLDRLHDVVCDYAEDGKILEF